MAPYPFTGKPPPPWSHTPQPLQPVRQALKTEPKQRKVIKLQTANCLETSPYSDFKFNLMFSTLVVGPSQSGKTSFVEHLYYTLIVREQETQTYFLVLQSMAATVYVLTINSEG